MAIWPFDRKKREESALPQEVQDYYASTRKQRVGVAWLLAIATVAVTLVLATALYFAGRWIYQRFATDNQTTIQTVEQKPAEVLEPSSVDQSGQNTEANNPTPEPNPSQLPGNDESSEPSTDTSAPAPTTGEVPNSGPGDIVAIFVVTSIAGAVLHGTLASRRKSQA